jgi:hypothetical protein
MLSNPETEVEKLTPGQRASLKAKLLDSLARQKIYSLFPETGPLSRHKYSKHVEFFEAGAKFQERAFIAANRIGKTTAAAYELTCHLLGWYPDWWPGGVLPVLLSRGLVAKMRRQ